MQVGGRGTLDRCRKVGPAQAWNYHEAALLGPVDTVFAAAGTAARQGASH
jgi:hypothetical protein